MPLRLHIASGVVALVALWGAAAPASAAEYRGTNCRGRGDGQYLWLLDRSFDFLHPNPDWQNISMLYNPDWDCLVEGKSWGAWWVENSYGTTFCSLPFLQEPWLTFLQQSQDNWFKWQGDGKRLDSLGILGPEGCLANTASPQGGIYNQADCNWKLHDVTVEHTAAGVLLQGELLLIRRDRGAIRRYLRNLERACDFMETRRDPANNLFLAGPAANLTGPGGFCGFLQPDGTYGQGYLSSLSVTYLAALDRMVEIYKLLGQQDKLALYQERRRLTRQSLPLLTTPAGTFCHSMERDGTKHGVLGQEKWGYFESFVNIDAIAHRVADQQQAERIYAQIAALPGLRPHAYVIANYPSRDDIYDNYGSREHGGLFTFGMWNNGGAWSHLEARTILSYYRLGKYEDVRRSALRSMEWADAFQMDAPLKDFGGAAWFQDRLTNLCYDALGIPAATVRGLFEYRYLADGLMLYPHVPPFVAEYSQRVPIRFGDKRLFLSVRNGGPRLAEVRVNSKRWPVDATDHVLLPYDRLPQEARVELRLEGGWPKGTTRPVAAARPAVAGTGRRPAALPTDIARACAALAAMRRALPSEPGAAYARSFLNETLAAFDAYRERLRRHAAGLYPEMKPAKLAEVAQAYRDAAAAMYHGLDRLMARYAAGPDPLQQRLAASWKELRAGHGVWRNVRAFGTLNEFEAEAEGAVMRIEGKPGDSNGWDVPVPPVDTTRYPRMEVLVRGSANAKVSWCVLDAGGVEFAAVRWRPAPATVTPIPLDLPPGRSLADVQLYAWTDDGKLAQNTFQAIRFVAPDGTHLQVPLSARQSR